MRNDKKRLIGIIAAVLGSGAIIFGFIAVTDFFVSDSRQKEETFETLNSPAETAEALGVVSRITEPNTGRITGYDARGVVISTDTDENILTLGVSEDEDKTLVISLGESTDMLGFLDKRSASSESDGSIEKNTYTSDTAGSILEQVAVGQTVLVHIPVWIDTPDSSECDDECIKRVESLQARGELYTPVLEDIIYTSDFETNTAFTISMLEIEN